MKSVKSRARLALTAIFVLFFAQLLFILAANLLPPFSPSSRPASPRWFVPATAILAGGIAAILAGGAIFWRRIKDRFSRMPKFHRDVAFASALGLVVIVSIVARVALVGGGGHIFISSDAGVYAVNAQAIFKHGGLRQNAFVSLYPYLTSYMALGAGAMQLLGSSDYGVLLLLNILLDFAGAAIFYFLLKNLTKSRRVALAGFAFWALSPFEIAFSTLSLPIIAVNFCVIAILYLIFLIPKFREKPKAVAILLATVGAMLGFANALRPIFTVFLAVFVLVFAAKLWPNKKSVRDFAQKISLTLALVVVPFFAIGAANTQLARSLTGYKDAASSPGWSLYLGANATDYGSYSAPDGSRHLMTGLKYMKPAALQKYFLREAIARYESLSPSAFAKLLGEKALIIFGNQNSSSYNSNSMTNGVSSFPLPPKTAQFLISASQIYFLALISLALVFAGRAIYRKPRDLLTIFMISAFVALFVAQLFVEAMNRYMQPFYPILMLAAMLALAGKPENSARIPPKKSTARAAKRSPTRR